MTDNRDHDEAQIASAPPQQGLESRILRGTAWMALGFGVRQLASWLSMLVLVRVLEPKAFGVVALAFTVVSSLSYLRGSGVWAALVFRRADIEEAAASAAVYLTVSSVAVYALCFGVAPLVASAFHTSELTGVLRGLALLIVIGGLGMVPGAILERKLSYAAVAQVDLGGAGLQVSASLALAFLGAGAWSLVGGQLASAAFETAALWYFARLRVSLRKASWRVLRELFSYGRFAGGANIADFLGSIVDTISVGRILGTRAAGFFSVTFRVATMSESVFNFVIVRAMFPAFSILQNDPEAFRRAFVQHAQRIILLVLPVAIFTTIAARPIVLGLFGRDWSPVITPLRLLAVFGFVSALKVTTSAVFRGAGRPHVAMWLSLANVVLLVPGLIVLIHVYGLTGAATADLVALAVVTTVASVLMLRLIELPVGLLARTLRPTVACSAVLTLVLAVLTPATHDLQPAVALTVLLVAGIASYLGSAAVFARSVVRPMWVDLRGNQA